jgi:hypothetical protein
MIHDPYHCALYTCCKEAHISKINVIVVIITVIIHGYDYHYITRIIDQRMNAILIRTVFEFVKPL